MELDTKTLSDYVEIWKRRKWSLVLPAIIIFVFTSTVAMVIPSIYRSTSTILIEEQEIPRELVMSTITGYADQRLQSINQRIMSTTRLLGIIDRFKLYAQYKGRLTTEEIVERMKKDIKFQTISADVVDPRTGRPTAATIAFSLSYDGKNPTVVQQVASVLASLYLEENIKVREQQTVGTSKFLEEEAKDLRESLARLDGKISAFKEKNMNSLPELLQVSMQALDRAERDIDQMNDQLRTLKEKESYLQTQLSSIPSDAANQDKNLLRDLKAKLVQLESRYSAKYPDVIKTRAEIAELESRIGTSSPKEVASQPDNPAWVTLSSQLAGTQSDIESVKRQIEAVHKKRDDFRRRIELSPRVDETYKNFLVERNNTQVKYDDLMKKSMEAKVSQGLERGQMGERFTLIDPARLPEKPIKPNRPAIILIGLILGIGAGVGTASLKEYSDQSVRSSRDLAIATSLPILATVPFIVTWSDKKQSKVKRKVIVIGVALAIATGLLVFHFFIMDFDIFWSRLMKKIII